MKPFSILLLATVLLAACRQQPRPHLFPIVDNYRIGYIDTSGKVVIKPVFRMAGEFSEGLAAARVNGTYGYIDETGSFVIQPQFDYATPFSEGLAIVYKDGLPFFIDKNGEKAFEGHFHTAEPFENGRAKVETVSNAFGFIDKQGKFIIDTVFSRINPFIQGMAVVEGIDHGQYSNKGKAMAQVGVIDTLGRFIVPYGKYDLISDFEEGYFRIDIPAEPWDTIEGYTAKTGFIDRTGKMVMVKGSKDIYFDDNVHCGLVKASIHGLGKSHDGFMNLEGEIVINDSTYEWVNEFSNNRAFIGKSDRHYFIIDTQGKKISNETFSEVVGNGFKNGYAFVAKDGLFGIIDTNANFVIKPQFDGIYESELHDGFFFYKGKISNPNNSYERLCGIAKTDGSIVLEPVMEEFDMNGFQNGLIRCTIKGKLTYINTRGQVVWQETKNSSKQLTDLNIDFMNRGYFYAYSKPNEFDLGGFGGSGNSARKITNTENFSSNTLSMVVRPDIKDTIYGEYNAITVFIANTSKNDFGFNAQDSRLYMKVQAKDAKGQWKDIEYLPGSFCGNSYHTLTLEPDYYWKFVTPVYKGDLKTKLRIEVIYNDPADKTEYPRNKKQIFLYSNEYEGSINPAQFWRKRGYIARGIMDPYYE